MIHLPEIWDILVMKMGTEWISLQEVYAIVKNHHALDDEDYYPESPNSDRPKWKRNIRNVLQYRRKTGEIEWDDFTRKYRLTTISR